MENISPVYARFVLRDIVQRGIDPHRLFEGTSLTRADLETGGDIAMEDFVRVLQNGRVLSGNQRLGLEVIGRNSNIITLGSVGVAAAISPTLREGLRILENYSRLHITYVRTVLSSQLGGISVGFEFLGQTGDVKRFHMESAMMLVQHYVETVTGRPLKTAEFRFAIPRPDYADDYSKWLHSPVSFDWPQAGVELPGELLDLPSPYYDAQMWHETTLDLSRRIKALEGREKQPYTQYVEALMRASEPPLPDLAAVAEQLHMSERTLNRRLQGEGTSFRGIRANVLAGWARRHLLETEDSVEAIAAALGYQDAANFRRAFRKVEGCSPGEFRSRAR
jgi:AraC-like DNA-binding protein